MGWRIQGRKRTAHFMRRWDDMRHTFESCNAIVTRRTWLTTQKTAHSRGWCSCAMFWRCSGPWWTRCHWCRAWFHHADAIPSTDFFFSGFCGSHLAVRLCSVSIKSLAKLLHNFALRQRSFEVLSLHPWSITVDSRQLETINLQQKKNSWKPFSKILVPFTQDLVHLLLDFLNYKQTTRSLANSTMLKMNSVPTHCLCLQECVCAMKWCVWSSSARAYHRRQTSLSWWFSIIRIRNSWSRRNQSWVPWNFSFRNFSSIGLSDNIFLSPGFFRYRCPRGFPFLMTDWGSERRSIVPQVQWIMLVFKVWKEHFSLRVGFRLKQFTQFDVSPILNRIICFGSWLKELCDWFCRRSCWKACRSGWFWIFWTDSRTLLLCTCFTA